MYLNTIKWIFRPVRAAFLNLCQSVAPLSISRQCPSPPLRLYTIVPDRFIAHVEKQCVRVTVITSTDELENFEN